MVGVAVVGGGLGGLAAALRLARLGHDVTLLERARLPGGALVAVEADGFVFDGAVAATLLPAVLRDLFRKTGRPIEREVDLEPVPVLREHRWPDGSRLALPGASRLAQHRAAEGLGPGLGDAWTAHVEAYAPVWSVLRRGYLETPREPGGPVERDVARHLAGRESLARRLRRTLPDRRLVDVAAAPLLLAGHDLRRVPAWAGLETWLEQCFGAWRVVGGTHRLAEVLTERLALRGVRLETGTRVLDVEVRDGRAVGVRTDAGSLGADAVVCAVDPRTLPALATHLRRSPAAAPPTVVHLGLAGPGPAPHDAPPRTLALHERPGGVPLLMRPGALAPAGSSAWTLLHREDPATDPLALLAARGVDVREQVLVRRVRSPAELDAQWGGSPLGPAWAGARTTRRRPGPRTPVAGLYAAGAHAAPGAGLPFVGLSAALVVQALQRDLGLPTGAG